MTDATAAPGVRPTAVIAAIRDADLGVLLATSATCDVHVLDDERVLKLYAAKSRIEDIRRETRISALVHRGGLPSPWVDEQVVRNVDSGRYGVVYGRIHGKRVSRLPLRHSFRLHALARRFAAEHVRIHAHPPPPGLPPLRERIALKIGQLRTITKSQRHRLLDVLSGLPDGNSACHGDYHHSNLMIRGDGTAVAIDWGDGSIGPAAYDVARSWVLANFGRRDGNPLSRYSHRLFGRTYLRAYTALSPIDRAELEGWMLLNVAQRMSETNVAVQLPWLSRYLERHL